MIYPNQYEQNPNDSIVKADGTYDFDNISFSERNTIEEVIDTVKKKYSVEHQALGLANEAYGIKYKARYILHQIIVQKYSSSPDPLENLAVGFAYKTKGAFGRSNAIYHLNYYYSTATAENRTVAEDLFFHARDPFFSYTLAELYSEDNQNDIALDYALNAFAKRIYGAPGYPLLVARLLRRKDISQCVEFLKEIAVSDEFIKFSVITDELAKSISLMEDGCIYSPYNYRISKRVVNMEKAIEIAARGFVF